MLPLPDIIGKGHKSKTFSKTVVPQLPISPVLCPAAKPLLWRSVKPFLSESAKLKSGELCRYSSTQWQEAASKTCRNLSQGINHFPRTQEPLVREQG